MITALWSNPYLLHAWLAGLAMTLATGPLGCFVVWRRLAYFGDTMAHASLLGVALALLSNLNLPVSVFLVAGLLAVLVLAGTRDGRIESDTMLGILAHGTLALGLVVVALAAPTQLDLMRFLFGDILALSQADVVRIAGVSALVLAVIIYYWRQLVMMTLHADIARVEGIAVTRLRFVLMILLAAIVASAIQLVGALLITALLIIPAAAARFWAHTPQHMAGLGVGVGMLSVSAGLVWAYQADLPAAPAIVVVTLILFSASWLWQRL